MGTIRHRTVQAWPAAWALFALFLLPGCSQGLVRHSLARLIYQPVCPVCKAVRIEDCHCFHGAERAGYCQTCWSSLDPIHGVMPEQGVGIPPRDDVLLEELPEPGPAAPHEVEAAPGSRLPAPRVDEASDANSQVPQSVVRQAAVPRRRSRSSQAVLLHFADRDPPPAGRK